MTAMGRDEGFVPVLRGDLLRRDFEHEAVVWSPIRREPIALDPVATVMLGVIDGSATVADLTADVQDVVGVSQEVASAQVHRIIDWLDRGGALASSAEEPVTSPRSLFVSPISSCMETSSCTGKVTAVNLQIADQPLRVACGSAKVARKLRSGLKEHLIDEQAPLGFMVRAHRSQRHHVLVDRGGLTLGSARRPDEAVAMVAGHLTALHPPAPGRVRLRMRALVRGDEAVLCAFPVLFAPPLEEGPLAAAGYRVLDRLAVDLDAASGAVAVEPVPWTPLARLDPAEGHVSVVPGPLQVAAILFAPAPGAALTASTAATVARLAAEALSGRPEEVLDVAATTAQRAHIQPVDLGSVSGLSAALQRL
jgi:hypothetical protein